MAAAGCLLTLFATSTPLAAQSRRSAPPPPRSLAKPVQKPAPVQKPTIEFDATSNTVSFSMSESQGMPLLVFVKWAQEVSGKRFTFNARELASGSSAGAAVNFIGTVKIDRDRFQEGFYSFLQTMLYIKGYAIIPRGEGDLELLEIVMMTGTRGREVTNSARYVTPDNLEKYRYQPGVPILTAVPLQHINAQLANNALRPFFASTGGTNAGGSVQIGNVGNKSALLLQGFGPQVYAAVQLLRLVDTPDVNSSDNDVEQPAAKQDKRTEQIIVLEHTSAADIAKLLDGSAPAKKKSRAKQKARGGETESVSFSMTESDGMELTEFIEWAQQITGKRFTYNAHELTSGAAGGTNVNFLGTFEFERDRFQEDFYAFFQTMLYIKGFAIIPRGAGDLELLEIVMMRGTRGRELSNSARYVAPDKVEQYRHQTGVPILTTVQLNNINAQHANNALRPFFASTGAMHSGSITIGNVGNKSSLLLQGFGPQVLAAIDLLKLVDGPSKQAKLVARAIPHPSKNVLLVTGTQRQVRDALDVIARADVPRGFGFTSFGQATIQDTDDDGLPDTRLPDFGTPVRGKQAKPATKGSEKTRRTSGKSVIF